MAFGPGRAWTSLVKIIDKRFFEKACDPPQWHENIADITTEYSLNEDQTRTFWIVANHVALGETEQLKMYIGGMGGTSKSQVIKALKRFFKLRGESYHFVIIAPTGNAASQLGSSTYHHMFGVHDQQGLSNATLGIIKDRRTGKIWYTSKN